VRAVSGRGLLALRTAVIAAFVLIWNGLMFLAVHLNGGLGRITAPGSRWIVAATTLATAGFCGLILASPRARGALLSPRRAHLYNAAPYVLICVVCLILGAASLLMSVGVLDR
jgi:hypothetical protein